jgi:septal ring factor EnvC (AmiA/AmiB activator)
LALRATRTFGAAALAAAIAGAAWPPPGLAQTAAPPAAAATAPVPDPATVARNARQAELDAITHDIAVTQERQAELRSEIDSLDKDGATLNATLIDTAKRVQDLERQIDQTEKRMSALAASEDKIHASLVAQRDVLAEVLAALQRMGRRPTPAIVVRPEDALASVRSAILLGAVVPDLRSAADRLSINLRELLSLRAEMESERDHMRDDATKLAEEQTRVQLLLEEKRKQRAVSAAALTDEETRSAALADQATNLKDLIARMETEIQAAAEASAEANKATASLKPAKPGARPTSLGSSGRLAPAVAFADARGLLPLPVNGALLKTYGVDDGLGTKTQGITIATRAGAQVSSPADGWVVYAGPFRSYGQLLIINAGGGYHVLLAGMERIDVQLGQFVLAGEPVAMMASQRLASAAPLAIGATQPVLYIEFRKDGNSIDPAPWWAPSNDEKVGG